MIGLNPISNRQIVDKDETLLSLRQGAGSILSSCLANFAKISNLKIQFGFEIEFYLQSKEHGENINAAVVASFLKLATEKCSGIDLFDKIELERGAFQCEIKTKPSFDVENLLGQLQLILSEVENCCKTLNLVVIYDPRPFVDDCGSAFQVNFSLIDGKDNVLSDSGLSGKVAGFVASHFDELLVFCNEKNEDFARYDSNYNRSIFKKGKFVAPTSKSWGYDNRTCAVRVLNYGQFPENSRIEFRVASNNCDKRLLLSSIILLLCEFFSLDGNLQCKEAVYGNSFDDKYVQDNFPMNCERALESFFEGEVVYKKMAEMLLAISMKK